MPMRILMVASGRARRQLAAAALLAAAPRGADAGSCSRGCEFFSVGDRCSSNSGCTGSAASCVCESYDNSCAWAHDGECDTMLCADGGRTDCSDCFTCSDGHAGGLFMLGVCVFVASVACMFTSIKHKRKSGRGEPIPMAWVACVVLFCFFGPCLMWVPFAMDNCYQQPHGRPVHGGGARPQLTVTTMAAQPVMAQPVMATAVPAVAVATVAAQPVADGHQPGYGQPASGAGQPPVAVAVPM